MLSRIQGLGVAAREEFLLHQFAAGNVPAFLREFVPISLQRADALGQLRQVEFEVLPDYLALGSDLDWFRTPMSPNLGQRLADMLGCALPTRRMVDDVWAAAPVKLNPVTFSPSIYDIVSPTLFYQHHQQIEAQRAGQPLGTLVAGTKKDVIVSSVLAGVSNRVVIYGWHFPSGSPIQPRYAGHIASYVDYSHGVRLVRDVVRVDGVERPLASVLADPVLHPLLGDEGAFSSSRYQANTAETLPLSDRFSLLGGFELASWRPKFTPPQLAGLAPRAPGGGDGRVVVVRDPAGGTDSLRCGHPTLTDQVAQADLYCEHRPELAGNGFERVGIFARDRAAGAFDGTQTQGGACYAMAWDSHDGRLWCMRVQGPNLTDLLPSPMYLPSTAWRRFRIEARGTELRFALDGVEILRTRDTAHGAGEFGIGYHEFFANNAFMRGARADNWHADTPDALHLSYRANAGVITFRTERGVPGDIYFRRSRSRRGPSRTAGSSGSTRPWTNSARSSRAATRCSSACSTTWVSRRRPPSSRPG